MRAQLLLTILCATALPGQEMLWQLSSPSDAYANLAPFGDFDHDGRNDLLALRLINGFTPEIRILSGADGTTLHQRAFSGNHFDNIVSAGDFDQDGYPDYVLAWDDGYQTDYLEVWSPHLSQQLLYLSAPMCGGLGEIIAHADLDGDGLQDLLVARRAPNCSYVNAYSHSGALMYHIAFQTNSVNIEDVIAVGDINNDGGDDFLIGGVELFGEHRGAVAVISGRTGAILRLHVGEVPHDDLGYPLFAAGDVDHDGVQDYGAGNFGSPVRSVMTIWSGRTGALLQQWTSNNYDLGYKVIGGRDADLDGVPDVIGSAPGYPNAGLGEYGRVFVRSMRDREVLMYTEPGHATITPGYGQWLVDLGLQPGSPYPAFAITDLPIAPPRLYQIQVWRCSPAGTRVVGTGCSSSQIPTIGLRAVPQVAGATSRIVLGSASPGALAFCLVASAGASTFGGLSLPLSLDPMGFTGCTAYVPPHVVCTRAVGSNGFDLGYAAVELPLPLVATQGTQWAAQWFVIDSATAGYAATPRHEFRLQ